MRPMWCVASSPIFFQVFPPSSDLYAPSPQDELCRLLGSPVPTHTTEGSDGAIAMSPIVDTLSLSNTDSQVVPLFVVFQTPPDAVPTYTMFGLLSTTAKSSMRPPIVAGPISRNSRFLNLSMGFGWSAGAACALIANTPSNATQARIDRKAFRISFISISLRARPGMLLRLGRITHQVFWKGKPTRCKERRATRELRFTRKQFSCHHAVFTCNSSPTLAFLPRFALFSSWLRCSSRLPLRGRTSPPPSKLAFPPPKAESRI